MKNWSCKFLNIALIVEIAPATTIWWFNLKGKNSPNQRQDHIFSLCRVWVRDYKKYVWEFRLGRLQVLIANTNQP